VNCSELVELITEYVEGAMPREVRVRVEAHLADCDGCTAYLEQYRAVIRLTGMLTEDQVSPQAREALLRVFHDQRSS
jgi:anti-sigma factor RsiW